MVTKMANPFILTSGCWLYGIKPQYVQVKNLTYAAAAAGLEEISFCRISRTLASVARIWRRMSASSGLAASAISSLPNANIAARFSSER